MSKDRFDLEQDIMMCWAMLDEIKLVYSNTDNLSLSSDDMDALQNQLLGLMSMGELKFNQLWKTFEDGVNQGWIGHNSTEK
jgi:hypothetical protein